jgi:hypothetical protein
MDDAMKPKDGGSIGFALLNGVRQPPQGSDLLSVSVSMSTQNTSDFEHAGCGYTYGGIIIGMGSGAGMAGSSFRDQFSGYSIAATAPNCSARKLMIRRHDVGTTHGASPTSTALASFPLSAATASEWTSLKVTANATHIVPSFGGTYKYHIPHCTPYWQCTALTITHFTILHSPLLLSIPHILTA